MLALACLSLAACAPKAGSRTPPPPLVEEPVLEKPSASVPPTKTTLSPTPTSPTKASVEKPILAVESAGLGSSLENGTPSQTVEFEIVNVGNVPATSAIVSIKVEDLRGYAVEVSGEGHSCFFPGGLKPGKKSLQSFPLPRWINGISEVARPHVVLLRAE